METNYEKLSHPPAWALRQIGAGRLKGKTDINPQWRYEALTSVYGPCGIGWKYEIVRLWNEPGHGNEIFAFSEIKLYVKNGEVWSEPIPGIGGSKLVMQEAGGAHNSDEGYKMATTDALSVAAKMLGVGAAIYAGLWDGAKYKDEKPPTDDEIRKSFMDMCAGKEANVCAFLVSIGRINEPDGLSSYPVQNMAGAIDEKDEFLGAVEKWKSDHPKKEPEKNSARASITGMITKVGKKKSPLGKIFFEVCALTDGGLVSYTTESETLATEAKSVVNKPGASIMVERDGDRMEFLGVAPF